MGAMYSASFECGKWFFQIWKQFTLPFDIVSGFQVWLQYDQLWNMLEYTDVHQYVRIC